MKQKLTRGLVALVAACGIGAGSALAAAPAQAAPAGPLDLDLTGSVSCGFGKPGTPWNEAWSMTRTLKVTAYGRDWPNVTLQEFNGEQRFSKLLKKGESLEIKTNWFGCFPSSISGYTVSSDIDPLQNNVGFWWNLRKIENPKLPQG